MFWRVVILGRGVFGGRRGRWGPLRVILGEVDGGMALEGHLVVRLVDGHFVVSLLLELAVSCAHFRDPSNWVTLSSTTFVLQQAAVQQYYL